MTVPPLTTTNYEGQDRQVAWRGVSMADENAFGTFLTNEVASRLHDEEGAEEFETHLQGLAATGFAMNRLSEVLAAVVPEERDWAVGEAAAEAYLSLEHGIVWPWNMERDKRTPRASLPGADLVGFEVNGETVRLVVGEVKTSSDSNTPPNVMNGRSGMTHQLDHLASKLTLIAQILKWLLPRCKITGHEPNFNAAIAIFLDSGNRDIALFGVLIRDTSPHEHDLAARGRSLAGKIQSPTTCQLVAVYLPCSISELPARVTGGAA